MTAEQHYTITKANFIAASKALHLAHNPYDSQLQLAADAVREVFKVEPIHAGLKRSTLESRATQALIAIMKSQTDILDTHLAKLLGKKDNTSIYRSHQQHCNAYATESKYRIRFNQALYNYIESI